jgi:phospholipid/cholesterol/gamma-HCH transport system substrate-binding protein
MQRNALEPILGAVVVVLAAVFLYFAYNSAGERSAEGYALTARFSGIDGLEAGNDVRVSGVKVGQVTRISLEPGTFQAMVQLTVEPNLKLPTDTVATISSDGLLGGKYLGLLPGGSDDMLKPGSRIERTQSSPSIENLLSQVVFNLQNLGGNKGGEGGSAEGSPPAPAQPGADAHP